MEKIGDVNAVLIFDNYLAQNIDMSNLLPRLKINFLPPNVTNKHQPSDMGMIAALRVYTNNCSYKFFWKFLIRRVDTRKLQDFGQGSNH